MTKRRKHPIGAGKGRHGSEVQPAAKRPPGEIKPIISKSKHGKMIHQFHDTDQRPITDGCAGILAAIVALILMFPRCGNSQTDFYSPFHFVVTNPEPGSKSITDIYHVSTHVVITEATVSIGVDAEGGQKFNYAIQGVEREADRVRYIIPEGIIIHAVTKEGECVTWITSKFQWRLYSFLPRFVEVINEK